MKRILLLTTALVATTYVEDTVPVKLQEKSNMAGISAGASLKGNDDNLGVALNVAYTYVSGPIYLGIEDEFKFDTKSMVSKSPTT